MNTVLLYVVSNRETRALDHDLGTMTSLKFFAIALLFTSDTTHYILSTWTTCMFNYIFFLIASLLRTIRKPEQNIQRAEGLLALSSQHCSWLWESSCVAGVTETPCPWTSWPHILWLTRFLAPVCSLHFATGCQSFRCLGASQGNDFFFSSRHPFLIFWPLRPLFWFASPLSLDKLLLSRSPSPLRASCSHGKEYWRKPSPLLG